MNAYFFLLNLQDAMWTRAGERGGSVGGAGGGGGGGASEMYM